MQRAQLIKGARVIIISLPSKRTKKNVDIKRVQPASNVDWSSKIL
jgi:hypothetical protein